MPTEIIMPKVDMDMAEGTIATWYVDEGAAVAEGEPLFSFETDKSAMEVEAPVSGVLHHRLPEGTEVPIGEPVAWLYAEGETVGEPSTSRADVPTDEESTGDAPTGGSAEPDVTVPDPEAAEDARTTDASGGTRATPRARSLARDAGLDLANVSGSGPRGRVQADDVRATADGIDAPPAMTAYPVGTEPLAVTRTSGGTGAPLVMIHGFASDALSWTPLEGPLGRRPLIRIDLPGHGKSPARRAGSFAQLVEDVAVAFDGLSPDPVHLVGHSLGGAVCLSLADSRPERVASLTLIAPAGLGREIDGAILAGICRATRPEDLGPWLRKLVGDPSLITDAYVRLAMAGRAESNLRAAQTAMAERLFQEDVQAFDLRPALSRIAVPTRIVWGKDDAVVPWTHALQASGRVGLHLFDDVGHLPQIERPEAVAAILRAQLSEAGAEAA